MRIVLDCNWRTLPEWMLDTLVWQSINQRIHFNTMVMVFKIKNGMVPGYLMDKVHFRHNERYPHSKKSRVDSIFYCALRNADNLKLPRVNKRFTQNCVFYSGLKLYNELPHTD
jgi:hypothetical protein